MMNDTILSINNLSVSYSRNNDVVSNVSFDLKQGEIIGIVGESGSGKSTLLKAVLPIENGVLLSSGEIMFQNKGLSSMPQKEKMKLRGKQIGMVFQNPKASFNPIRTFRKQFIETLKSHGRYEKENFNQQVCEVFESLNLMEGKRILDSCPFEMSGGMNQRISIALSVLLKPSILLADEPTSALDVTSQEQVMDELLRMREHYQTSIIIVTHNIGLLAKVADKVGVMFQGRIVEFGTTNEVLQRPKNLYTKKLLSAVPKISDRLEKIESKNTEDLLELKQLSKEFIKNRKCMFKLSQVNMQLKKGEILGIVGESGSGKSTLLKQIGGLQHPTAGTIVFKGKKLEFHRTKSDYCGMQMIFQNVFESFNPRLTIRSSLSETLKNLCGIKDLIERNNRIDNLMGMVGLKPHLADRYPTELSGGQCQRAAIARAISVNPELLLCDEITSALDVSVQAEIIKLLLNLSQELNMAIIFVSHDIVLLSNICEKIMVMHQGKCIESGSVNEIIKNPKEDYTKRLLTILTN
ncbi:ABC transporter ATP-binding protein [Anaerosacchariphilus polymeriproducens]|uniref:ABC transporter ATP-binding protein n=1 Tax=Anaerosacchariphilus polymeriproducens TaxID=1812858 RepID=A0A371AZF4_9FIRM|nr:ABC transporter ATP-binding protein [Anaerosacchariphilus polymeriproducens]RDU24937.1 ABC transporter ATP-binding protein [Anaerosacchariphilus polymeriproducens]